MELLTKLLGSDKGLSEEEKRERGKLRFASASFLMTISLLIILIGIII